jgi:hypothetical protein
VSIAGQPFDGHTGNHKQFAMIERGRLVHAPTKQKAATPFHRRTLGYLLGTKATEAIGGAKARRIIILDACRNNPFKASMRQTVALRGSLDRGLAAPPEAEPGTLIVYSAKEGQAAVDGDGVNSPFGLAFVARFKKPGREVQRMFDDVRDDVSCRATNERQEPYKYGSLPGSRDFFFVAGK